MGVMERAQHCRLSNDAWQPSGMWCRWKGCEYASGTAEIRTTRNPHMFPLDIGIWCQCSQKYRWCYNTPNSLNSDHLDPEETACLDSLISDHILLHGKQLGIMFLDFFKKLITLAFLFSFCEVILPPLSLLTLSALS